MNDSTEPEPIEREPRLYAEDFVGAMAYGLFKLPARERLLCFFAYKGVKDEPGFAFAYWPASTAWLAKELGMQYDATRKALQRLVNAGQLTVLHGSRKENLRFPGKTGYAITHVRFQKWISWMPARVAKRH